MSRRYASSLSGHRLTAAVATCRITHIRGFGPTLTVRGQRIGRITIENRLMSFTSPQRLSQSAHTSVATVVRAPKTSDYVTSQISRLRQQYSIRRPCRSRRNRPGCLTGTSTDLHRGPATPSALVGNSPTRLGGRIPLRARQPEVRPSTAMRNTVPPAPTPSRSSPPIALATSSTYPWSPAPGKPTRTSPSRRALCCRLPLRPQPRA